MITLDSARFADLIRILSLFRDLCNDVDIREGVIRQKTNDNISVFEIDCSSILSDLSLPISDIKQKLEVFKCFQGQEVTIENDGQMFLFRDQYSMVSFKNPDPDFMDNKYINQNDFNSQVNVNDEDLLLSTSVDKVISDRIKVICQVFNTNTIQILYEGDNVSIMGTTTSKDQSAKFISGITPERNEDMYSNLSVVPFVMDHDGEIIFKMYENTNDRIMNVFQTTISDVNITIFCRSNISRA